MNKEVKRAWVEALRSGEYKQCTGRLRREDGYCCLGVLCDLYKKDHQDSNWEGNYFFLFHGEHTDTAMSYLPEKVIKWAGLSSENPQYDGDGTLSGLNDEGATFDEIADVIEGNL